MFLALALAHAAPLLVSVRLQARQGDSSRQAAFWFLPQSFVGPGGIQRRGAQGAAHADGKGQEPQARRTRLVGWDGILARRQGPLEVAVRRAPRGVRVLARDPGVSGRLTRLRTKPQGTYSAPVHALTHGLRRSFACLRA